MCLSVYDLLYMFKVCVCARAYTYACKHVCKSWKCICVDHNNSRRESDRERREEACDLIREGERVIVCVCVRESFLKYFSVSDDSVLTMRGVTQPLIIRHNDMGVDDEHNKQIRLGKSVKMQVPERLELESPECPAQRTKLSADGGCQPAKIVR